MELNKDLFVIPYSNNRNIIYAPLRGVLFDTNNTGAEVVKKYIENADLSNAEIESSMGKHLLVLEKMPTLKPNYSETTKNKSHLVIILSQICNLSCDYCFAKEAHSNEKITQEKLKQTLDYFLSQPNKNKSINFIGGGEPTMTWDLLVYAVEYVLSKTNDSNFPFSITTNGTLLTNSKLDFIKKHKIKIGLSFEVLPEIQNLQRGFSKPEVKSFPLIDEAIKKLTVMEIPYSIRSTITRNNVYLMTDMVEFIVNNYPNVNRVHFEQVSDPQSDSTTFYNDFIDAFFKARELGKQKGIKVYNSVSNAVSSLKQHFCGGELCLTPTGDISSCHRVSSIRDNHFNSFVYSNTKHLADINYAKIEQQVKNNKPIECKDCFAKWHCAGGCDAERFISTPKQIQAHCNFVKEITKRVLIEKLEDNKL
ncbi:MAG: radical SAM protein [Alphaproteobacteria bacterium]|jgi:radical SAM protein with 4Fe4S-binding SPASM domain|nr:radical SAM protein [Alphaproteobacteria bacterium]